MIPSASVIERTTNMTSEESIEMSFDAGSLRFMMGTMSKLYSRPEEAVVRELSTNARDAMIAAGRAHIPINVNLPNQFRQLLTIKDTGIGMDVTDLRNTYSKYGASSKRSSNAFNGMLGLGSKSPFAVTDQYTVVAVKDGVKTSVIVSRSAEGGGTMEVLSQIPTDDHNGVEIQIPTARNADYRSIAAKLFHWWDAGTVLVDGVEPKRFQGDKLTDKIYLDHEYDYYKRDQFVMGGVAYPLEDRINQHFAVIYFADNGEFDFAPPRESLEMTTKTRRVIEEVTTIVNAKIRDQFQDKLDNLSSIAEAVELFESSKSLLSSIGLPCTYKGYKYTGDRYIYHDYIKYNGGTASKETTLSIAVTHKNKNNILISQVTKLSSAAKEKLDKYAADNGLANRWIITSKMINSYWLSDLNIVEWETIKAVKISNPNSTKGVTRGPVAEYSVYQRASNWFDATVKLDATKPIYYLNPNDITLDSVYRLLPAISADAQLARVYKVKEKAFLNAFPKAKHIFEACIDYVNAGYAIYNDQDFIDYQTNSSTYEWQAMDKLSMDRSSVLDTNFFVEYDRLKAQKPVEEKYKNVNSVLGHIPFARRPLMNPVSITPNIIDFFKDYPLVPFAMNSWNKKPKLSDIIDYINNTYKFNKENK